MKLINVLLFISFNFIVFHFLFVPLSDCQTNPTTEITPENLDEQITTTLEYSTASTMYFNPTTPYMDQTTTSQLPPEEPLPELEIISINVIPGYGNAVKLVWGKRLQDYKLNWTYGVYYGKTPDELGEPRQSTSDLFAVVKDLEYCKKYMFGVGVIENYGRIDSNSSYIRSIVTHADKEALPQNLTVEFEPGEIPCILIRWSASCPSLDEPIGYLITVLEKPSRRITFVPIPATRSPDLAHSHPVKYGTTYDIKVSTSDSGFNSTDVVTFQTPYFLQPYKVRAATNPDGTFMLFWREPYIPYYVGKYYYEVYVYIGRNISENFERFKVERPVYVQEGDAGIYTFAVGLTSEDGHYKSYLSQPIVIDGNGETYMLEIHNG